jgi:D-tyrosyl-tRNA(Tyr) deacylase
MRALVQRVDGARVVVAGETVGQIEGPGLLVLVGVTHTDTHAVAAALAAKVYHLRIFDALDFEACLPPGGPREVSAHTLGLPALVVSQFTLYADTNKGRRPTWEAAAPGALAEPLVDHFSESLRALGAQVAEGIFGADMRVESINNGPMTLLVEINTEG